MQKQKGAALVTVLAFLTGAMIVGVSGMQSSLIDERLAGNYRASVLAQMAAEDMAGYIVEGKLKNNKKKDGWNKVEKEEFPENQNVLLQRHYFQCGRKSKSSPCQKAISSYENAKGSKNSLDSFYIARGQVLESSGNNAVAKHSIIVEKSVVGKICIFCNLIDFEGESVIAGEEEDSCGKKNRDDIESCKILGEGNVPRPYKAIENFISKYDSGEIPKEKVVISCDDGFNKDSSLKYVLCMEEEFEGEIGDKFDGLTIIVSGEKEEDDGEIEYDDGDVDDLKVKSSVNLNIISTGDIKLKGFGNNTLTGNFWSGDEVEFTGGATIVGGVVAVESIEFKGKTKVSGGLKINDESDSNEGDGDTIWFSH